jgi:multisubunit Na+/H+ antiporter MnhG subunit
MHFSIKNILKNNHSYSLKQAFNIKRKKTKSVTHGMRLFWMGVCVDFCSLLSDALAHLSVKMLLIAVINSRYCQSRGV